MLFLSRRPLFFSTCIGPIFSVFPFILTIPWSPVYLRSGINPKRMLCKSLSRTSVPCFCVAGLPGGTRDTVSIKEKEEKQSFRLTKTENTIGWASSLYLSHYYIGQSGWPIRRVTANIRSIRLSWQNLTYPTCRLWSYRLKAYWMHLGDICEHSMLVSHLDTWHN